MEEKKETTKETTKTKRAYVKPVCETITVREQGNLMQTSFPGQHNPANPGTGPTPTPAKRGWLEEESTTESSQEMGHKSLWDD